MDLSALPRRFTERETAQLLGISLSGLRALERRGEITPFRPTPRKIYYLRVEIDAFIERRTQECRDARKQHPGQIGDYWPSYRPNSPYVCRTWYDKAGGQTVTPLAWHNRRS